MKKLISLVISLVMVGGIIAQNNPANEQKVFREHSKKINSNIGSGDKPSHYSTPAPKASLISEGFEGATFPPNGWTTTHVNANANYQWSKTAAGHQHTGGYCAAVYWDPAPSAQDEWLISPSLNLTTLTSPLLNFWWSMSYGWGVSPNNNYDFKVKVSIDNGATWSVLWTEDSAGVFTDFKYYKKTINLNAYHTCSTFKIAFQYKGADGYNLFIDDITIADPPVNSLEFTDVWAGFVTFEAPFMYSGYSQIPLGQSFPVTMDAEVTNTGSGTQTNAKINLKEIVSGTMGVSTVVPSTAPQGIDTMEVSAFYTISTAGTSKIAMYLSSDSIPATPYKDTFNVVVNTSTNGFFSRDNNYYTGSSNWNGATGTSMNAFQMANLIEVTANTFAKSISAVIGGGTTANAPVKAILYRGWGQTKTVLAESNYHFVTKSEMATTVGANPKAIEFFFNGPCPALEKDSVYFAAIQAFGGSDTVLIAANCDIPQPDYAMYIFDTDNKWYYFGKGNDPCMIRLNTNLSDPTSIIEKQNNTATLFQNMPNPASKATRISYELTKTEKVAVDIYDLTGRKVSSFNEGNKTAGVHNIDVNLNNFSAGTYFYTLRAGDFTKTMKMIVK